ncbi:hypothetical protein BC629DRAFT_428208 [Irpex lacteus]|nr:hypothetical protein BC629DRAFT_428208 [Irpex lacteus]
MSLPTSKPPLSDGGGLQPDTESPAVLATPVPIDTALDIEQRDDVPNPNSSHNVATTTRQDPFPQASRISSLSPQRPAPSQHPTNKSYSPMSCHEQSYGDTTAAEVQQANLPSREKTEEPSSTYLEKRQDGAVIAEELGTMGHQPAKNSISDHIHRTA